MADYIDRDTAIKIASTEGYNIHDILFALKTIPAHRMVYARITEDDACPECGCYIPTDDVHDAIFKDEVHYCYYCGTKFAKDTNVPVKCEDCRHGAHWDGVVICDRDAQRHERTDGCERGGEKA